jgi:hypothetical protein
MSEDSTPPDLVELSRISYQPVESRDFGAMMAFWIDDPRAVRRPDRFVAFGADDFRRARLVLPPTPKFEMNATFLPSGDQIGFSSMLVSPLSVMLVTAAGFAGSSRQMSSLLLIVGDFVRRERRRSAGRRKARRREDAEDAEDEQLGQPRRRHENSS